MTRLQSALQRACQDLSLSVVIPFVLTLREDVQINAQALLPQLGSPNGMIVVNHYDDLCGMANEIVNAGYGYSVLDDPMPSEDYDLDSYMDMFSDWGWEATNP
jgi:hypothetical protein